MIYYSLPHIFLFATTVRWPFCHSQGKQNAFKQGAFLSLHTVH